MSMPVRDGDFNGRPVLPANKWAELHDFLTLALDALGDSPEAFSSDFLRQSAGMQRGAARLTRLAMRGIEQMEVAQ